MRRRRSILALIGLSTWVLVAPAQTTNAARDEALRRLAARLTLPLIDESMRIFSAQLRRTLPPYFVDTIGRQLGLGPQWRRGNPWFDETLRQTDAALANEEERNGPLLRIERADLLDAINVPWTLADIAFVEQILPTDLGREAERAIDAQGARQAIATLKRRAGDGVDPRTVDAAFADVDARAQSQFADASLMLLAMKGADPPRAQRLQRLVEGVSIAPSDAIGQRVVDRLSRRLLEAATAQWPNLLALVAGFKAGS